MSLHLVGTLIGSLCVTLSDYTFLLHFSTLYGAYRRQSGVESIEEWWVGEFHEIN